MKGMLFVTALIVTAGITWSGSSQTAQAADATAKWHTDVNKAVRIATAENRPILLFFTAKWCTYCHQMQRETLANPMIARKLKHNFVLLLVDADEQPDLVESLNVDAFPTTIVVRADGKLIARHAGFMTAPEASKFIETATR